MKKTEKATEAAKVINKKSKQDDLDDMKNTLRKKPLHGRNPLRTDNGDVDRATTHQWLSSSSLKGETEDFTLAAQNQSLPTRMYQVKIFKNGTGPLKMDL